LSRLALVTTHGLAGALLAVSLTGCERPSGSPPYQHTGGQDTAAPPAEPDRGPDKGPPLENVDRAPTLRVRIARSQHQITVEGAGGHVWVGPAEGDWQENRRKLPTPLQIRRNSDEFQLFRVGGSGLRWRLISLRIEPAGNAAMSYGKGIYPGSFTLVAVPHRSGPSPTKFDMVNHVGLERYLPGVLAKEFYSSWEPAAFRAQAVAARSYALFEAWENRRRHYDLTSTTASQVYAGQTTNPKAVEAARATRGEVLTYKERVLPAYYSSSCGGTSQAASLAFDDGWHVQPLTSHGGRRWCQASSKFRWGPIDRPSGDLAWRINQWGDANRHPVGKLEQLRSIEVSRRSAAGRPAAFTINGSTGRTYELRCEPFRFACNYDAGKLTDIPQKQRLLSSHVTVTVDGQTTRFTDGRGFGHGVGLCQWGAQGMAKAGHEHTAILGFYYPGTRLQRLY
jgi:stage II sporulation protein D